MAGQTASGNDREFDLIFKAANNLYTFAFNSGVSGLTPPNLNDSEDVLWKKIAYYTASTSG